MSPQDIWHIWIAAVKNVPFKYPGFRGRFEPLRTRLSFRISMRTEFCLM